MRRCSACFLWLLVIILGLMNSAGDISGSEVSPLPVVWNPDGFALETLNRPAGRSLMSYIPEAKTQLIATLDGTIQLVEINSGKIYWSFTSGAPIYTTYRAPINKSDEVVNATEPGIHYVEFGENWELIVHTNHNEWVPSNIEELFRSLPVISSNGAVTVGSKKTTVFQLDAMSGRLINSYQSLSPLPGDEKRVFEGLEESGSVSQRSGALSVYITRTDYLVQSFAPNSNKVLWNTTVSEIEGAIICHDIKNSGGGKALIPTYELGTKSGSHFLMPMPCHQKTVVVRQPLLPNMWQSSTNHKRLLKGNNERKMLPEVAPNHMLPLRPKIRNLLDSNHEKVGVTLPASDNMPAWQPEHDKVLDFHHNHTDNDLEISRHHSELESSVRPGYDFMRMLFTASMFLIVFTLVGFVIWGSLMGRKQVEPNKQPGNVDIKTGPAKRKKIRKLGKNSGSSEKKDKNLFSENEDGYALLQDENTEWLDLNKLFGRGTDGRRIGKLFISSKEIAKGSNGTIILEGIYEGRPVAVKRLVKAHHDVAIKEIQNLIASDRHPNIVRWYGVEYDQDFVYLSLERCSCSLDDLIQKCQDDSPNSLTIQERSSGAVTEYNLQLDSVEGLVQGINLWKANGNPSLLLLQLMRDVVSGIVHLHELGIVHRDLKPQNVLIIKERHLCAKLSDMGISKRLHGDTSSLGLHATGCGSSGWQAPEQLVNGRQTRAVDMFSLGCVLFFCITGGRHPFGERLERDINIVKNQLDLMLVEGIPEAVDLFSQLLSPDPEVRPKAFMVLHHPLFWSPEMRLSFLRDTSDRVELEDREAESGLLKALESTASVALGSKWDKKMESAFLNNIGRYRRYKFDSVRDLLRVIRNKLNHYRELPQEIQELLGPVPEGFDGYFASRFPKLLIEVYKVLHRYCGEEEFFHKYFKGRVV